MVLSREDREREERLEMLYDALEAHGGIGLSELDGFVAALCVMPLLPHKDWISYVLGAPEADPAARLVLESLVMVHSSATFQELGYRSYVPQFMQEHDEILWQEWAVGFGNAAAYHPTFIDEVVSGPDEEAVAALNLILALAGLVVNEDEFRKDIGKPDELMAEAPTHLIRSVYALFESRYGERLIPRRAVKIGRNDPCPCGSGKKYKKCCGVPA
ncbi:UPF0149 family protein [Asticcacaulis sp. AC402]|uniref:UPF0149 family protein n=1 Tax=Asticcacaulis sp. AC402 TaxID=1282361 RepID=UPI0003C3D9E4|nr:UPF0149 family protein [Asticcacaulis sp. AC402]ESQ75199.1 hypothetical protein ABAC402_11050 [Asticcacaulis sp. AC402]